MARPHVLRMLRCWWWLALTIAVACCGGRLPEPETVGVQAWGSAPARGVTAIDARTDPGALPALRLADEGGPALPLSHTHVDARLSGFFAEVEVRQTYNNPYDRAIETVYVFPLPDNSAVDRLRFVIGTRVVEAEIRERKEARRLYERAKSERHNVFTQSIANIPPGATIDVVVHYLQDLSYDAGEIEFAFPMVVGPRYIPGAPALEPPTGTGTRADTDRVPDASRVTPPVLAPGQRSGHDISIELQADAGAGIEGFEVPTHEVVSRRQADGSLHLTLAEKESIPNRDFVLRYRVAGPAPRAALYTSGGARGTFALVVHPPALEIERLVGRREILFVVDVSGSMSGVPLARCKAAMRDALRKLRPGDTFDVITFSGSVGRAFAAPRRASDAAVREALGFVDGMIAGGGTEMADAVEAALGSDVAERRRRYVFFMTDGLTGEEERIARDARALVERLEAKGGTARVFGFGVGSSVDREAIEALSRAGRGVAVFATNREDPARAVNRFFRYIDRSVVRDLTIDWGGLDVTEVFPRELPDLFASHALIVHGRYSGEATSPIVVRGTANDEDIEIPVSVRLSATPDAPRSLLATLWARSKIASLEEDLWAAPSPAIEQEITRLGLAHRLVTKFTSFVAVDRSRTTGDGRPTTIVQPVEVPEDVDAEMAGAYGGRVGVEMYAVQQVYAPRARRLEIHPYFAAVVNDRLVNHRGPGLSLDYYLTNLVALGIGGTYYRGLGDGSSLSSRTTQAARLSEPGSEYAWSAGANVSFVPAWGKLVALGSSVFHYDLFLVGGLGAIATRPISVLDPAVRAFDFTPRFAFELGGGLRLFLNRWLAARFAVTDTMFFDRLESPEIAAGLDSSGKANAENSDAWTSEESTFTANVQLELGLSLFLPLP